MKEIFTEQQEQDRLIREAVEAFMDDDWQYQEYLKTQGEEISQKESQANHDAWWNSLTNDHKQKLYDDQVAFDELAIELSVEEMNHDLSFGK